MNKHIFPTLCLIGTMLSLGSCSQELPFDGPKAGEGYLNRDAMAVEFKNADILGTRANINVGDFRVEIKNKSTNELVKSYHYADMPEIVALPVGEYTVNAVYGDNHPNKWENPYYLGNTEFAIESGKVTDNLDPVVCKLSNIRIKVQFGPQLSQKMGEDSKVEVRVGQGQLNYTKDDQERSGYFAYTPGSQSITATFNGTIDGDHVYETKSYDNASAGNVYNIDFKLHSAAGDDSGDLSGSIIVDATIGHQDITEDIDPDEEYLEDDMRPKEDQEEPGPDTPNPPAPEGGPTITARAPIDLTKTNIVDASSIVVLDIVSEAEGGFTEFYVDIDSTDLTPILEDLDELSPHLDLINPGQYEEGISGLNLPVNVGGHKEETFDISGFMEFLIPFPGVHKFHLTVSDANGTTQKTLILQVN